MTSFLIKIIAIICMTIDHSGDLLLGHFSWLNIIGRIAFPLFAFQLVIGYNHTKDVKKYLYRMTIFSIISQIPFTFMMIYSNGNITLLNVFFTFVIGIIAIILYDTKQIPAIIRILGIIGLIILAQVINVDFQAFGIVLILLIHIFYDDKDVPKKYDKEDILTYPYNLSTLTRKIVLGVGILVLAFCKHIPYFKATPHEAFQLSVFTFLPTVLMLLYNGKKGPSLKYFFYIYYPLHMIVLVLIHIAIN